jgi:hypothetical protein
MGARISAFSAGARRRSGARRAVVVAALAPAVAGAVVLPAPAAAATRLCRPSGGKVVAIGTQGAVYKSGRTQATIRYVACYGRRTKPLRLGGDDCFNADEPSQFAIAGRLLAYVNTTCDTVSGNDTVIVVDLRTRKRRYQAPATATPAAAADVYAGVDTLALARGGEIAWIATYALAGQPRIYEVRRSTATNRESVLLDAGPEVRSDSLALSPNLVYWTRGATPRSAPLR